MAHAVPHSPLPFTPLWVPGPLPKDALTSYQPHSHSSAFSQPNANTGHPPTSLLPSVSSSKSTRFYSYLPYSSLSNEMHNAFTHPPIPSHCKQHQLNSGVPYAA